MGFVLSVFCSNYLLFLYFFFFFFSFFPLFLSRHLRNMAMRIILAFALLTLLVEIGKASPIDEQAPNVKQIRAAYLPLGHKEQIRAAYLPLGHKERRQMQMQHIIKIPGSAGAGGPCLKRGDSCSDPSDCCGSLTCHMTEEEAQIMGGRGNCA